MKRIIATRQVGCERSGCARYISCKLGGSRPEVFQPRITIKLIAKRSNARLKIVCRDYQERGKR